MNEKLELQFKELRGFIETSAMTGEEQVRAKVMLSNIKCDADGVCRDTDKEIERVATERVEAMRKEFKVAYTKLANEYMELEKHKDSIIQQLSELNSKCGQLEKQLKEKENNVIVETVSEKDKEILNHIDKVKDGNISFKDNVDMSLIVDLYIQGYGAGKIEKALKYKGITVARQTVVNRLSRIGLWGKRGQWSIDSLTDDEKEYIDRHNLDISKLGISGKK